MMQPESSLGDRDVLEKLQATIREYNYLLTSQLEEQRHYFESKIEDHQAESYK